MFDLTFKRVRTSGIMGKLSRAKVPGGWLVLVVNKYSQYQEFHTNEEGYRSSLTFLPDPTHQWEKEVEDA